MAGPNKKGAPLQPVLGRPPTGVLGTYSKGIKKDILKIRKAHEGWGADSILLELEEKYKYCPGDLPSLSSAKRLLKEQGCIKAREPLSRLPVPNKCERKAKEPHDVLELDAQGAIPVKGLGHCASINIKDHVSKLYCMTFPVSVRNKMSQPKTPYYYWALRLSFQEWGLSRVVQVDKDSVFRENRSKSPFPKLVHLWLIGLGVELCFIKKAPPQQNATVERSHQTMERQTILGQEYGAWKPLFRFCNHRREKLNTKLPNRMLGRKAPLQAFPDAVHSGREYNIEKEESMVDLKRVYPYLAKGNWFRKVSSTKTLSLGGEVYYLKDAEPRSQLQITFCNRSKKLLFRNANELLVAKQPIKNFSTESLMGATTKQLISMKYKLYFSKQCPIET